MRSVPMNERNENSTPGGLPVRGRSRPRCGVQRLIPRWAYHRPELIGITQLAGAGVAAAGGAACLWYGGYRWAASFLAIAVLDLASGSWFLTIARSSNRREAVRPRS
jgi:hypothetical protein